MTHSAPLLIMMPQEIAGGRTPMPRNASTASAPMIPAIEVGTSAVTGPIALGSTWRNITRRSEAPSALAAVT